MIFKKIKNSFCIFSLNNNIQNNQKFKRSMFTKGGNSVILKKSGEIIIPSSKRNPLTIAENVAVTRKFKALDLANSTQIHQQHIGKNLNTITTVAIKNINTGQVYPLNVNRKLATFSKVDKNYPVEWKANNTFIRRVPFKNFKAIRLEEANFAYKKNNMSEQQFYVFIKRLNALDISYIHSTINEIIEEDDEFYTFIYSVITTSSKKIDYGGPNTFKPKFLYYDEVNKKNFYVAPITYMQKLKKTDYCTYFSLKNEEVFKRDGLELQKILARNLKQLNQDENFKLLNVQKDILDVTLNEVNVNYAFPESPYSDYITSYINHILEVEV